METCTVGQLAELFGPTVRTLHHYDEIGLLSPSERSAAGYRLYDESDMPGCSTSWSTGGSRCRWTRSRRCSTRATPASPASPKERVMARLDEMRDLVAAIDNALEKTMSNEKMTADDLRELFGDGLDDTGPRPRSVGATPTRGQQSLSDVVVLETTGPRSLDRRPTSCETLARPTCSIGAAAGGAEAMDAAEQHRAQSAGGATTARRSSTAPGGSRRSEPRCTAY